MNVNLHMAWFYHEYVTKKLWALWCNNWYHFTQIILILLFQSYPYTHPHLLRLIYRFIHILHLFWIFDFVQTKGPSSQSYIFFPVVMYEFESCTIKKAEGWRIDAFELWCWRRLLRVPWTARRSNQSILKEISVNVHSKGWCWKWNSNTLATWCEELTHLKRPWW